MSTETEIQHIAKEGADRFISERSELFDNIDPPILRAMIEGLIQSAYTEGMLEANKHALNMMEKSMGQLGDRE